MIIHVFVNFQKGRKLSVNASQPKKQGTQDNNGGCCIF